jgi:hypothetical protein
LAAEELGICEEILRIGGDSGRFWSIPRTGKKRAALRSFSARWRGWGRHETAVLCVELGLLEGFTRGRERPTGKKGRATRKREREEGGGRHGFEVRLQEVLLVARTSRRWHSGTSRPPRSCLL